MIASLFTMAGFGRNLPRIRQFHLQRFEGGVECATGTGFLQPWALCQQHGVGFQSIDLRWGRQIRSAQDER
jgi:hypothetical protein